MMRLRLYILLISFVAGGMGSPLISFAQSVETPFGGLHGAFIQCTCGPDSLHYIFDYRTEKVIDLLFEPYSRLYSAYDVDAGQYQLGTYQPSGQQCMIYAGTSCTGIYADGTYGVMPGTGTSFSDSIHIFASAFSPLFRMMGLSG